MEEREEIGRLGHARKGYENDEKAKGGKGK